MFNIVTNIEGIPHAVLVRAVEPLEGVDIMLQRTGKKKAGATLTQGPGRVGKAFGFHTSQCHMLMNSDELYIGDDGFSLDPSLIVSAPRIGVDYAGEHAEWHYRFYIKGSPYVSGLKK
jgi:DNA-3-methyladenine glycosylase